MPHARFHGSGRKRELAVTIRFFRRLALNPEEVGILCAAFDEACQRLALVDRDDPMTELVAGKIIEAARQGARDPAQICSRALAQISTTKR